MEILSSPWWAVGFLVTTAFIARRTQGSWLAPSAFCALLWALYFSLPLILMADRISAQTMWIVAALISCVQIGALLTEDPAGWRHSARPDQKVPVGSYSPRALAVVLISSAVAFIGAFYYAIQAVRQFAQSFSLEGFFSVGAVLYSVIVAGQADPWWFRLTRMWLFPALFVGGTMAALPSTRLTKILSFSGFVPALIVGTTLASRYGTTMGIGCWISGYLAAQAWITKGAFRLSKKAIITASVVFAMSVGLYAGIGILRGHHYGDVDNYSIQLKGNLFGYLAVLDYFIANEPSHARSWGQYSVAGVADFMGMTNRVAALNYEPIVIANGVDTNIYTAFRGLIQDFSLPGALFLSLLGGAAAGRAYTRACAGRMRATVVLAAFYSFILWSPIVSVFNYNSVLLGLIVSWIVIVSCEARLKERPGMRGQLRIATL